MMDNYNSDIIQKIKERQKQNEINEIEASNLKSLQELNYSKMEKADADKYFLMPCKHSPDKQPWQLLKQMNNRGNITKNYSQTKLNS